MRKFEEGDIVCRNKDYSFSYDDSVKGTVLYFNDDEQPWVEWWDDGYSNFFYNMDLICCGSITWLDFQDKITDRLG